MSIEIDSKNVEDVRQIVKSIVEHSLGEIEKCVIASEDGIPIVAQGTSGDEANILAAIAAPLLAAAQSAIEYIEKTGIKMVNIELDNGKHLIVTVFGKKNILAILTRVRPNLGLIYYLLEKYGKG